MRPVLRILDASANRAREGLRVLEDLARFALDHAPLASRLKALRHDLQDALTSGLAEAGLQPADLLTSRDTTGDVGTAISTTGEMRRTDEAAIAAAAGGRLTEALRSAEESLKALPAPRAAQRVEACRYAAYTIEKDLLLLLARPGRQWTLCLLLTAELCPGRDWLRVARATLEAGADAIQLREKLLPHRELLDRATTLVKLAAPFRADVIVNDRADVAILSGAAGVHVGQDDLPAAALRTLLPARMLIGVSTSSIDQAHQASRDGADYCGVGPIFPSATKAKPALSGPAYLTRYLTDPVASPIPHLAISGITPENVRQLADLGCRGVAVSSAICAAPDPAAATAAIIRALAPNRTVDAR